MESTQQCQVRKYACDEQPSSHLISQFSRAGNWPTGPLDRVFACFGNDFHTNYSPTWSDSYLLSNLPKSVEMPIGSPTHLIGKGWRRSNRNLPTKTHPHGPMIPWIEVKIFKSSSTSWIVFKYPKRSDQRFVPRLKSHRPISFKRIWLEGSRFGSHGFGASRIFLLGLLEIKNLSSTMVNVAWYMTCRDFKFIWRLCQFRCWIFTYVSPSGFHQHRGHYRQIPSAYGGTWWFGCRVGLESCALCAEVVDPTCQAGWEMLTVEIRDRLWMMYLYVCIEIYLISWDKQGHSNLYPWDGQIKSKNHFLFVTGRTLRDHCHANGREYLG